MSEHSDEADEGGIVATQTERDVLTHIQESYGTMPKDVFISTLVTNVDKNVKHLQHIRGSLFDYGVQNCGIPEGILISRKDTMGGTALYKLACDVYDIYAFIDGDKSVDIVKVLNEASRKKLDASDPELTAAKNDMAELVSFIERFKDCLMESMGDIREAQVKLQSDVDGIKKQQDNIMLALRSHNDSRTDDILSLSSKLCSVESSCQSIVQGQAFVHGRIDSISSYVHHGKDVEGNSSQVKSPLKVTSIDAPVPLPSGSRIIRATVERPPDPQMKATQQNRSQRRDPYDIKAIPSSTLRSSADARGSSYSDVLAQPARDDKSTRNDQTFLARNDQVLLEHDDNIQPAIRDDLGPSSDGLEGFTRISRRPKREQFFVYGIKIKDTIENTKTMVADFLINSNVKPTMIRIIKRGSLYLSLKINTDVNSGLDNDGFWPEGIGCRKWNPEQTGIGNPNINE